MLPGQIFGEMALITGDPSNATAEAEVYSELIAFDRIFFQSLLIKSPNPIQRIIRHLMEQLRAMHNLVQERTHKDLFLSVCQLLELFVQAQGQTAPEGGRSAIRNAVSYADFCRAAKTILIVAQHEIDETLDKLARINLIKMREIKAATYKRDILGQVSKSSEYLRDRILVIPDLLGFMAAARNLRREFGAGEEESSTTGLDYMDIRDFAMRAGTEPGMIYRLICQREIPEGMICFPSDVVDEWLRTVEDSFFDCAPPGRKRGKVMVVDEIVDVDNAALQLAFSHLGQQKVIVLYAAASSDAKAKIMENVSTKMKKILREETFDLRVEFNELAHIEDELSRRLAEIGNNA